MPDNILTYRDYKQVAENGREFPRSDLWEFKFLRRPSGVYVPSDLILNIRTNELDLGIPSDNSGIEVDVRSYTIHQSGLIKTNGTLSFSCEDREDFSISYFKETLMESMSARDNRRPGRKVDYTFDIEVLLYNTNRAVIKGFTFLNLMLTDNTQAGEEGLNANDASSTGSVTINANYEHYTRLTYSAPIIS